MGRTAVSTGRGRGVDGWGGSGAWIMGGLVCGYNTGPIGIPVCSLALQAYHLKYITGRRDDSHGNPNTCTYVCEGAYAHEMSGR